MKCNPMEHQKGAVRFAIPNNGIAAFYHEVGCGKTISALLTFEELRKTDPLLRLLVICPISLIHGAWAKEIEKFTDYGWFDLHSKKGVPVANKTDIFIINFESLNVKRRFDDLMNLLRSGDFMVAVDESSKMKNHQAAITEKLLGWWDKGTFYPGIKQVCKHRILMSGTPAPNIEWEYWAQMNFLNAEILGPNFYQFRNKYFSLQRGQEIIRGAVLNKATLKEMFQNGYKYEFDAKRRVEFFERMSPWVHMVKAKDCLDLPESIDEYRAIIMEDDQARVYKEMKVEYIAEIKQQLSGEKPPIMDPVPEGCDEADRYPNETAMIVANIILTKMMKLRQITSGFAIDEGGDTHEINAKKNPKINALLDIVEECGDQQIIVWGQFKWEIAKLVETLSKIGGVSELHGGIKQEERINHVNDFLSGKNRFLVAHPKSAAHGLTFVNCHIMVFFSFSYSYEEYSQARGRIMRHGQRNNCIYFHIVAQDSVDGDILGVCQRKQTKQDVAERFLNG